jgi:hypothetical protein
MAEAPVPPERQTLARRLFHNYPVEVDMLFCMEKELREERYRVLIPLYIQS